ncbi:MAG: tRNA (adenosine(37)-N6)-threonylcarbamoyltransferase complex ATPase subunit type 1 TsaE [Clostridia bacterium]|nr:tRNA (adenosine(37)-N6)-threonylcarbamoyltransferase complex ATPase subunit type 1 TsaE [Clostridia bacterium]
MEDRIIISRSPEETEQAGAWLAGFLGPDSFIALDGELGAGKTAFVRGLASILCPGAKVKSPTYAIVRTYPAKTADGKDTTLCHFDMYRIADEDDLYSCGWDDYEGNIIAAEWMANVPFALPEKYISVNITKLGENEREITIRQEGTY